MADDWLVNSVVLVVGTSMNFKQESKTNTNRPAR